jgi:glutamine amidotransferase
MYFIHSFFCNPKNKKIITSTSKINNYIFCSSIRYRNIECFQFHPEKSGIEGLKIYFLLKEKINSSQ